jgi:hypothetical protein
MSKSAKSHHPNQRALRRTANLDAVTAAIVGALCVGDGPALMSGRADLDGARGGGFRATPNARARSIMPRQEGSPARTYQKSPAVLTIRCTTH